MEGFRPLFEITVEHGFFSGACNCLKFVPSVTTRRMLENAGLLLRKRTGGILMLYDHSRNEAMQQYLEHDAQGLNFEFKAYATDPEFKTYTKPFPEKRAQVLFFNSESVAIPTGGVIRLHESEHVSAKNFVGMNSALVQDVMIQKDRLIPPLFVVRIHADKKSNPLFDKRFRSKAPRFYLNFDARQTYWKYYLHSEKVDASAFIHDPDNRVEFEQTDPVKLSDGRTVLTYRSKQSIPMKNKYDFRFQLKQYRNGGEKILYRQLPLASINQIGREVIAKKTSVVSEIYINC